ncbi:MAG: response regulator [Magnetococcales bacterium]|nr:response regulator [Magnetococcales bacterium]
MESEAVTVLVVDDSLANRQAMLQLLTPLGCQVVTVACGEEALQQILQLEIALILMDVNMPDMDGYQTATLIKSLRTTHHIPIIFLTAAYRDPAHLLQAYQAGGVDYLEKPFNDLILLSKVSFFLDLYRKDKALATEIQRNRVLLQTLQEERQRFADIIWGTGVGTWEWNVQTGETCFNERWAEIIGYTLSELQPVSIETWLAYAHPEDLQQSQAALQRHFAGESEAYECESRMRHKNGEWIWVLDRGRVIRWDQAGRPLWMSGTHFDITERKRAEMVVEQQRLELEQLKNRYQLLFANSPDAYFIMELDGGVISDCNQAAERMLRSACQKILGMRPDQLSPPRQPDGRTSLEAAAQIIQETLQQGSHRFEWVHQRSDGEAFWAEITISLIDFPERQALLVAWREITDRKQMEVKLIEAKDRAEQANRAKSEFLANMSHEIRTPMNAILGMADLLWESDLVPEQRKFVQVFRSAGENLLNIINDILDLSKIEAGQLVLERIAFDLAEEMQVVCDIMALRCHAKGLQLQHRIYPGIPSFLLGDPTRLRQIFLNLLGNAVKFTEQGAVHFAAEAVQMATAGGPVMIEFRVADTGSGIPAERLASIFDHFVQVDSSITRRYGGTGLGLAIVKRLTEAMGGRVDVASRVGQGTEFRLLIPFQEGELLAVNKQLDLRGVRILIVDDVESNRLVFRETLLPFHAEVEEAGDAPTALQRMEEALAHQRPYDVILLDVRMPGMDGFQLLNCWRAAGRPGAPILIMSSEHQDLYLQHCRQYGVQHYMIKPVRRVDLLQMIDRIRHPPLLPGEQTMAMMPCQEPVRILLADDSEDNRLLIQSYLKGYHCRLHTAENGVEALRYLENNVYDLVFMDIQMPVMDGYAATRAWRRLEQDQNRHRLPIIALTAYALAEDVVQSKQAGCDAHLTKPLKKKTLLEMVERFQPNKCTSENYRHT